MFCEVCTHDHSYPRVSEFIESQLEDLDAELKEKITPAGAGDPIPDITGDTDITETEIDDAIEMFDELLSDYLGMLKAKPTQEVDDPLYEEDYDEDWEWDGETYVYKNTNTDTEVDETEKDGISIALLDLTIAFMLAETSEMILKEQSIQEFTTSMSIAITLNVAVQYTLGSGGKNTLKESSIDWMKDFLGKQKAFFQKFAEQIREGKLTGAKILQRLGMYGEAVTEGYEQAKAASHNIKLPEYPADGNQKCLMNCRCWWELVDDGDFVNATWKLNPIAEHCETCVNNSRKWNPLRVKKGE